MMDEMSSRSSRTSTLSATHLQPPNVLVMMPLGYAKKIRKVDQIPIQDAWVLSGLVFSRSVIVTRLGQARAGSGGAHPTLECVN